MSQAVAHARDSASNGERIQRLLERARDIAERVLAPRATEVDQSDRLPTENLRCLAEAGLLGLATPTRYGGAGSPPGVVREFLAILASACGVTTFVQMQHVLGCFILAHGENEPLKEWLLPLLASGERFLSVGYSHLRRPGPPMVRAAIDGDQFVFNGNVPWMTGWGIAGEVVLGGTLPDGRLLYVAAPVLESDQLRASPPMRLCAATASATVSLACRDLRVPRDRHIQTITLGQMAARDSPAAFMLTSLSLGVATAAARLIRESAAPRADGSLSDAAAALEQEIAAARALVDAWADQTSDPDYATHAVRVRARCIELGVRAAHTAAAAAGGSANLMDHPAQRLLREAMLYTLVAQSRPLQAATLDRLTHLDDARR
jgi:alkylation response protein AidB-like acyl-CoA dehydrogenase